MARLLLPWSILFLFQSPRVCLSFSASPPPPTFSTYCQARGNSFHYGPAGSSAVFFVATTTSTDTPSNKTVVVSSDASENENEKKSIQIMLREAQALRGEALSLERALNQSKIEKASLEEAKIDKWIQDLLFVPTQSTTTELLNTAEGAFERLKDDRFSQEQVNKIFRRICSQQKQSRSNHSPIMALLLDAVGKLDDLERQDNPNKRWSGRVEQALQKKLFAADWNIELQDEEEADRQNPFKLP